MELTTEQSRAVHRAAKGANVFLTGSAGTGKSFTIARIIADAERRGLNVAVTSTTGIAALNIGGCTLHSWAGVGLGNSTLPQLVSMVQKWPRVRARWQETDLLIVDEVSMLTVEFFDKLETIARTVRYNDKPFGGIQLCFVGDFLQLPPVCRGRETRYCFQSRAWEECALEKVELTRAFRQKDSAFFQLLQRVRIGQPSQEDVETLRGRVGANIDAAFESAQGEEEEGDVRNIYPTSIHSHRASVQTINEQRLCSLKADLHTLTAVSTFEFDAPRPAAWMREKADRLLAAHLKHCPAEELTFLKTGAQVMLLHNLDQEAGLVNGSRGVVEGWTIPSNEKDESLPIVRFLNGTSKVIAPHTWESDVPELGVASVTQTPLLLAWAITVHKAQGCTLDCASMQLDASVFAEGQAYVALSRVRTLEGLTLTAFDPISIKAHPDVVAFYTADGGGGGEGEGAGMPPPRKRQKTAVEKVTVPHVGLYYMKRGSLVYHIASCRYTKAAEGVEMEPRDGVPCKTCHQRRK